MASQSNSSNESETAHAPETETPADAARAEEARSRQTRQLPAIELTADEPASDGDNEATILRPAVKPPHQATPPAAPQHTPLATPRKNTLAVAITRPAQPAEREAVTSLAEGSPPDASPVAEPPRAPAALPPDIPDEVEDEVDEWTIADQPTVYLPPRSLRRSHPRQSDLDVIRAAVQRPAPPSARPRPPAPPAEDTTSAPPRRGEQQPGTPPRTLGQAVSRPFGPNPYHGPRLASPTGRPMPNTPPQGIPRAALPDPRMQRFQELRQRRLAYQAGIQPANGSRPVAEIIRQWWNDLLPGLQKGLHYQREARASGVHPIPAHVPSTMARLGDAFGRLAASARELRDKAQAAMAPTIRRLHDQAEHGSQALVEKIERASPVRQQAPLLGPGRIAVFFHDGVSVRDAQALLAANHARPIRLIPRKRGFLALVAPGAEAATAERLREYEQIRDVEYLEFDEYGQPVETP